MATIIRREWTSREMMKLEWRVKTYGPDSRLGEGANRQRVILIVHLRLNAITLLELSHCQGLAIYMHTDFLAILVLDDIVPVIDVHQIPLDHLGLFEAARSLLIGGVRRLEQSEAQQRSTRQDPDDFGNGYHRNPPRLEIHVERSAGRNL